MANGTPKAVELVKGHRTKAEKTLRERAEKNLASGSSFTEWSHVKNSPVAHGQFLRLKKLFREINQDDGLIESVINRYCLILAECIDLEEHNNILARSIGELEKCKADMEFREYIRNIADINKQIQLNDRLLLARRKMLLDIEKENIMTTLSQLRSIPKKILDQEEPDPMEEFFKKRGIKY